MRVGDSGVPPGVPRLGVPDMALGWQAGGQRLIQSRRTGEGALRWRAGGPSRRGAAWDMQSRRQDGRGARRCPPFYGQSPAAGAARAARQRQDRAPGRL